MTNERPVIAYLSGPVDGVAVYEARRHGGSIDYLGTSYLREFFQVCEDIGADSVVVTSDSGPAHEYRDEHTTIVNFPKPAMKSGLRYHLDLLRWTWRSLSYLASKRPDVVVLTDVQNCWFLARFSGIRNAALLPALHCVIEKPFAPAKASHRLLHWLNRHLFYRRLPSHVLAASPMIERQARAYCEPRQPEIDVFLPTYREQDFASAAQSFPQGYPFTIISAGRIEGSKGVFDLVEMASIIDANGDLDFRMDICGSGSCLDQLREMVGERGLTHRIVVHGYCGRDKLLALIGNAHAVVVPTRSSFEEGFAMICAEAAIAGRPVITSRVCPALEVVLPSAEEAAVDDIQSYVEAIYRLARDPSLVSARRAAAFELRRSFFDPANGYGAKLRDALLGLLPVHSARRG